MQRGDLVRHVHLGGCGLIVDTRMITSNITMGKAEWLVIQWLQTPTQRSRDVYMPAFLEPFKPTDKNCPLK
jgi:hypothetical protein